MSKPSIDAHEERFDGWPTLPTPTGAYLPAYDGDIAELSELSERVFDAVKDGAEVPTRAGLHHGEDDCFWDALTDSHIGARVNMWTAYWPDDRAAEQLSIWRFQLDRGEIA